MARKITKAILTGAGIAGLTNAGALVYNNIQTIASNEKMHSDMIQLQNKQTELELNKLELDKYKLGLSSKYNVSIEENSNTILLTKGMTEKPISQTSLNNEIVPNSNSLTSTKSSFITQDNSNTMNAKLVNTVDSSYPINASLESNLLDLSTHNLVQSISYTFMCFSFIGFFAILCLALNLIIQFYSDRYFSIFPKWCQSYLRFYQKYIMFSNVFYILWILFSQSMILVLCFYLFYNSPQ
jgi:hypothetical protein